MRIYLAARYSRRLELCGYAEELRAAGHAVECRWLLGNHQHEGAADVERATKSVPLAGRPFAEDDWKDVLASDALIAFSEEPRSSASRGGRHVEFGLALAWGMRVVLVGPRENVFHTLPQVEHFWHWGPDVIRALQERVAA